MKLHVLCINSYKFQKQSSGVGTIFVPVLQIQESERLNYMPNNMKKSPKNNYFCMVEFGGT